MTFNIPKSVIDGLPYDFAEAVASHIKAKEEHRFSGGSAPVANELVEAAIRRVQYPVEQGKPDDFFADFAIIDDTPPPPTLTERRAAAYAASREQEAADIDAILSPGKLRLLQIDANDAYAVPLDQRTAAHEKAIQNMAEYQARVAEIQRAAAVREAAIDEMT